MQVLHKRTVFLLLFTFWGFQVHATESDLYLKAERQLTKGYITAYKKTLLKLGDHPLQPYLEAKAIKRKFYRSPIAELDEFFAQHEDAPYSAELRRKWLHYLAKRKKWRLYLEYYQPTESLVRQCHYVRALGAEGHQHAAYSEGKRLWLIGRSLPKACDPVFANWKKQNLLTEELIWQRLLNALDKRQYKLVRYLRKKLSAGMKHQANIIRRMWRTPGRIFGNKVFNKLPADARYILVKRAIKKSPMGLLDPQFGEITQGISTEQSEKLKELAYYSAAKAKDIDNFEWFYRAIKEKLLTEELNLAFLEGAILNENWPLYAHLFKVTPSNLKNHARWHYWQGRALNSMGAHPSSSIEHFEVASKDRNYYGFMASQALGIAPSMNHNPTYVDASKVQRTRLVPAVKRALLLWELERVTPARREWQFAFDGLDLEGRKALALLAGRYEWADRAIMTLAQLEDWHDLQLRFPLAHEQDINNAAKRTKLAKNWIYGIARQESAFQFDARSPAGAMGLMQLMPRTAQSVSSRYRMRYSRNRLLKPNYNLNIGSRYMRMLLNRYKGNRVLATAAYNAGPANVGRWLKRFNGPVDLWIERIPFKETREYVQRVLAYSTIYSYRLGELQPILDTRTLAAWESLQTPPLQVSQTENQASQNL